MGRATALLCELEGVVVDTLPLRSTALRDALATFGLEIPAGELQRAARGRSAAGALQQLGPSLPRLEDAELTILALDAERRFSNLLPTGVILSPGATEFLRAARSRIPLAAVTRTRRSDAGILLTLAGLEDTFAFVISADDVVLGKPDPAGYREAIARLVRMRPGVATEVLAFEDGVDGIVSARAAGAWPVAVGSMHESEAFTAEAWLPSLEGQDLNTVEDLLSTADRGVR